MFMMDGENREAARRDRAERLRQEEIGRLADQVMRIMGRDPKKSARDAVREEFMLSGLSREMRAKQLAASVLEEVERRRHQQSSAAK